MSLAAPVRIPVELRRPDGGRWFRLATWVAPDQIDVTPPFVEDDDLDAPFAIAFQLPGDGAAVAGRAHAEREGGTDSPARASRLRLELSEEACLRTARYVEERLGIA